MSAVDRDRLVEVLSEHQLEDGVGRWLGQYRTAYDCICGVEVVTSAHEGISRDAARIAHQADALDAELNGEDS